MAALTDYFEQECDEQTYSFVISTVTPNCERSALVEGMVEFMSRNKADPTVTADLLSAAGWTVAVAPLRKGRLSVRRGDFAEVLAAEAAEAFDGLLVPVRKLRYQIDPNGTMHGSDVVGFVVDDDEEVTDLEFVEVKYRTNPSRDIAIDAHDQLARDRDDGFATTVNFLAHRLRETDAALYESFLAFLASSGTSDCRHTVVLAFEEANWDDDIAEELDDLPEHLPELWLRVFPLDTCGQLVEEVYAELMWDVFDDD